MVVDGLIEGLDSHGADAFGEEIDEGDELSDDVARTGAIHVPNGLISGSLHIGVLEACMLYGVGVGETGRA